MTAARQLILFYDEICPLCLSAVEAFRQRGLLDGIEALPSSQAEPLGLPAGEVESVRSEMLLRDLQHDVSLRGFDALLALLEAQGRCSLLVRLGSSPLGRAVGRASYKLVAYNRRILSPPATGGVACACDPPARPGWRLALLGALLIIACASWATFAFLLCQIQARTEVSFLVLETLGTGLAACLVPGALAALLAPRRAIEIFWQGAVVSVLCALTLLVFGAAFPILNSVNPSSRGLAFWATLGLTASLARAILSTIRRHGNLRIPRGATLVWILAHGAVWTWALLGLDLFAFHIR